MSQGQKPPAETAMSATEARTELFALVKRAEEDGVSTLIHKRMTAPCWFRWPGFRQPDSPARSRPTC